jgi:AcrR family transcriptional regulator
MADVLSRERILEAAEEVLRRFGPQKTTVVDVARVLNVSHGSIYRHFDSKLALRDAVVETWLKRTSAPLRAIAQSGDPPRQRLRRWFDALLAAKRQKVGGDPELFRTAKVLFAEAREVVARHVATLVGQIETILRDADAAGELSIADPHATAQAMFDATARFHDPAHVAEWSDPGIDASFERVYALMEAGLRPANASRQQ